jgi:hypothetical protein
VKRKRRILVVQGLKLKKDVRKLVVSKQGLAMLQQRLQVAHHGLMSAFVGEHPSAARACRLAKRWISSQMLSYQILDEAVELIVAAAYSRCFLTGALLLTRESTAVTSCHCW